LGNLLSKSKKEVSYTQFTRIIILPKKKEVRRKGVKKDIVIYTTEKEIDKMIANTQITQTKAKAQSESDKKKRSVCEGCASSRMSVL